MRIEIKFADDANINDVFEFLSKLYDLLGNYVFLFEEVRVAREPKQ